MFEDHPELRVGADRVSKRRLNGNNLRHVVYERSHRHRPPLCCGRIIARPMTESEHREYHRDTDSPWRLPDD